MRYEPTTPPANVEDLAAWIAGELLVLTEIFVNIDNIILQELNVEPIRPRTGMVVLADGTNWNPGSGSGFYGYRGGAWQLLG